MTTDNNEERAGIPATPASDPGDQPRVVRPLDPAAIRRSPYQVRADEPADPALAQSIAVHGLLNPVTVRPDPDGEHYELIAGHRRLAAWRAARPDEAVPAIVLDADDLAAEDLLVAENLIRQDLCAMEVALTVAQLRDHGRTVPQVATTVRHSERWVYRYSGVAEIGEPWRSHAVAVRTRLEELLVLAAMSPEERGAAWDDYLRAIRRAAGMDYGERSGHAAEGDRWRDNLIAARGDRAAWERALCAAGEESGDAAARAADAWWARGLARFAAGLRPAAPAPEPAPTPPPAPTPEPTPAPTPDWDDDPDAPAPKPAPEREPAPARGDAASPPAATEATGATEERGPAPVKRSVTVTEEVLAGAIAGAFRLGALHVVEMLCKGSTLDSIVPSIGAVSVGDGDGATAPGHDARILDGLLELHRWDVYMGGAIRTKSVVDCVRTLAVPRMVKKAASAARKMLDEISSRRART